LVFSLIATILLARPDLAPLLQKGEPLADPIPLEPPPGFFDKEKIDIEGIGEPTSACFLTLSRIDPKAWYPFPLLFLLLLFNFLISKNRWIFEKYDGIRGFWNPLTQTFYSRKGKAFSFPKEVTDAMPQDIFLDGEIW